MLKSTYSTLNPLPPGWTEHKAPTGHLYYYNAQTKQSTYKRPSATPPDSQPAGAFPTRPPFGFPAAFAGGPTPGFTHPSQHGSLPFNIADSFDKFRRDSAGERRRHDRRPRHPEDRPKSKHAIPGCDPWVLVKTKLGRRFVHNPDTNESFWKFPADVLRGVIEYDRLERERRERGERGGSGGEKQPEAGEFRTVSPERQRSAFIRNEAEERREEEDSDEYEEVEVTDDEDQEEGDISSKKARIDKEAGEAEHIEFNEDDIEYQLAAMGEDYGLDPGEYGEPGDEGWEAGAEGLPLTEEDSTALFRDLLDDFRINPYTPWEKIVEEAKIIDDARYTILPNMKSRREAWSDWSRQRIQELKEQREKEEKRDPRICYLTFLQEHATPKLYWPEFRRKYRKEPEMKDNHLSDKEREKFYRDHISRLKLSESSRKSDLSALLKSTPLHELNRSSTPDALPTRILTDLRYISLPPKVRDPLIEAYISTLPPAPEPQGISSEEQMERDKRRAEREKRERALAEREVRVQEQKWKQRGALMHGRDMLRQREAELEMAMRVGKGGLKSHMESEMATRDRSEASEE